ncbi:MAG: hypothetical protein R3A11_07570 [Bdellovibrionota bacterium]
MLVVVGGLLWMSVGTGASAQTDEPLKLFPQQSYLEFVFVGGQAEVFYQFAFGKPFQASLAKTLATPFRDDQQEDRPSFKKEFSFSVLEFKQQKINPYAQNISMELETMEQSSNLECFVIAPWGQDLGELHCRVHFPIDAFFSVSDWIEFRKTQISHYGPHRTPVREVESKFLAETSLSHVKMTDGQSYSTYSERHGLFTSPDIKTLVLVLKDLDGQEVSDSRNMAPFLSAGHSMYPYAIKFENNAGNIRAVVGIDHDVKAMPSQSHLWESLRDQFDVMFDELACEKNHPSIQDVVPVFTQH